MPDRIEHAVDRLERAASRQRRIEGTAAVLAILLMVVFQLWNRNTFLDAQRKANRAAAVQREAFSAKLDEQGRKLDDANRRVGQLEEALRSAGLRVPDEFPTSPSPTTTTTTAGRTPPPPPPVPPSTTTSTSRPPPATTTTTTVCVVHVLTGCFP